jgi:membrane protease YdiL (CAAX protease family)
MQKSRNVAWLMLFAGPALAALAYLWLSGSAFFASAFVTVAGAVVLTGVAAWLLPERDCALPPVSVPNPRREAWAMILFMAAWAVLFLGWGLDQLNAHTVAGPERSSWRLLVKLVTMVALPSALLLAIGGRVREQWRGRFDLRGFWLPLAVLGAGAAALGLLDPAAPPISAVPAAQLPYLVPLTLLWGCIEAGLCEEYLFRACLQTRLAAWLKSDFAAIALGALIFGLSHFPGFAWRQPPPGAPGGFSVETLAFCLTAVAAMSLLFGLVWARTRNLWLVVGIHGLADIGLLVAIKPMWFPG